MIQSDLPCPPVIYARPFAAERFAELSVVRGPVCVTHREHGVTQFGVYTVSFLARAPIVGGKLGFRTRTSGSNLSRTAGKPCITCRSRTRPVRA
jgi:hypothetical protein